MFLLEAVVPKEKVYGDKCNTNTSLKMTKDSKFLSNYQKKNPKKFTQNANSSYCAVQMENIANVYALHETWTKQNDEFLV